MRKESTCETAHPGRTENRDHDPNDVTMTSKNRVANRADLSQAFRRQRDFLFSLGVKNSEVLTLRERELHTRKDKNMVGRECKEGEQSQLDSGRRKAIESDAFRARS